jgi:hypothetical protein
VALSASAQIYQWKDQNGKTVISDKPPIGQVQQQKQTDSGAPESGPRQPSLADREMEFRKRRKEAQEKAEKAQEEERAAARKNENCQNARRQLRALESGERMSLRGDDGERHYLDDAQRGQEAAKMRQIIENQCPE